MLEKKGPDYQKETVKLLRDQTDALKENQRIAEQTTEQNKAQTSLSRTLARLAAEQASSGEDGLKYTKETKDVQKDLNKALAAASGLTRERGLAEGNVAKLLFEQESNAKKIVDSLEKELKIAKDIDGAMGLTGKGIKVINKLFGDSLGDTKEILENTRKRIAAEAQSKTGIEGLTGKMKGFGIGVSEIGKSIGKNLNDPLTYLMMMLENSTSVNKFQKELGVSYSSAIGMRDEMTQIASSTGDVFINSKKISEAFSTMNQELGFIVDYSGQTLETMVNLEKRLGLASGEAAKLTMLFKLQGDNTEEQASNLADSLNSQIKAGNVAISAKQIFNEIAKTTAIIQVSLGGTAEEIGSAIIAAKQLGAELSDIDTIAGSLLNFESSIENELQAELLTGKQLNLEKARLLALNNDLAGVAEEVAAQGIDYNFMTTANRLEQEAIASALGLSRDSLAEIVQKQAFQGKSAEEVKNQLGGQAYEQFKALDAQEKFTASVEKIKGIFQDTMVALTPIIDGVALLADLVGKVVGIFGSFSPMLLAAIPLMKHMSRIMKLTALHGLKGAIAGIFQSFSKIPLGLGIPLAFGAVGGLYSLYNKMDDGVIGSDGGMVVSGPKGSIQLNKDDSIVAGTNLGGGSGGEKFDYNKMASAMSQVQINTSIRHDSFGAKNQSANHGSYQSDAKHQTRFA